MVQHMVSALRTAGCEVDLTRHISCDMCQSGSRIEHAGGYDPALNQVFVCANKYDFQNADHLACTEIRKANLVNCGYMVYMQQKWATMSWKNALKDCVKNMATGYLINTKFVKEDVAKAAVSKVFDKCYNNLEPIGRRAMNGDDISRANSEKFLFGYY